MLSLDGGGVRGLIPAKVLTYLEQTAAEYVTNNPDKLENKPKIDKDLDGKSIVGMHYLFNMISGTSTGSIIAGMLTIPTNNDTSGTIDTPEYSAGDAVKLYSTRGEELFQSKALSNGVALICAIIFAIFMGWVTFYIGKRFYDNKETYGNLKLIKKRCTAAKQTKC